MGLYRIASLLLILLPLPAWAAEEPPLPNSGDLTHLGLEQLMQLPVDVVYGASKYEQKVTRAPASVTIVTADDIDRFGYRNLADVLRSVPGLYVSDDRNYSFLGVRGFSQPGDFNTGILLLVNGHRVNDPIYNLFYIANEALIDVDTIERVEFIRGPSSSIYGNSAFFGVINLITKHGSHIDGLEVSGTVGSFETYKTRSTFGKKFANDVELILSGSHFISDGQQSLFYPEYADSQTNNGFAVDADREKAVHWFGSLTYRDFTVSAAFSDRHKRVPTAPYGSVFNAGRARTTDRRGFVDVKYERAFAHDLKALGRVSYDWYPYRATWPYENSSPPPDPIINRDRSLGQWARAELQLTQTFSGGHTLIYGAEYQDNLRQHQQNFDEDPFTSYLDIDHSSNSFAFYTQGEFTLHDRLLLNAGVRYDHFDSFGETVNPRLGLIYSPAEKKTFKLLYGEAFRAPNDYELNFESSNYERNPDLKPETIRTYELVFEQHLSTHLRLSAAAYHYDINGLISQATNPLNGTFFFKNTAAARANGLELQLEGRYANGLLARGSYALQHARDVNTNQELSNSPRHLAKFNLSMPLRRDILIGNLELQYNSTVTTVGRQTTDDNLLVNLTFLSQKLVERMKLSASVYNLLDTRYSIPSSGVGLQDVIPQNGRSFLGKLTYTF